MADDLKKAVSEIDKKYKEDMAVVDKIWRKSRFHRQLEEMVSLIATVSTWLIGLFYLHGADPLPYVYARV